MAESSIPLYATQSLAPYLSVRFELSHSKEFLNPDKDRATLSPPHIHNCIEIFFNVSGDASFLVNNRLYPLLYGDAILSRPSDVHVCLFNKSHIHEHFCLWIEGGEELFPFLYFKREDALFRFEKEGAEELAALFFDLHRLVTGQGSTLEKTACFLKILSFFEHSAPPARQEAGIPPLFQRILDDIHEHFSEIHHVNQLTDKYFISHATLNRWFRGYLHTSPRDYLESKKLACAVELLQRGETVTDACMKAGFPCCSHFIVLFKKKFGCTPLKYKKRMSEGTFDSGT